MVCRPLEPQLELCMQAKVKARLSLGDNHLENVLDTLREHVARQDFMLGLRVSCLSDRPIHLSAVNTHFRRIDYTVRLSAFFPVYLYIVIQEKSVSRGRTGGCWMLYDACWAFFRGCFVSALTHTAVQLAVVAHFDKGLAVSFSVLRVGGNVFLSVFYVPSRSSCCCTEL